MSCTRSCRCLAILLLSALLGPFAAAAGAELSVFDRVGTVGTTVTLVVRTTKFFLADGGRQVNIFLDRRTAGGHHDGRRRLRLFSARAAPSRSLEGFRPIRRQRSLGLAAGDGEDRPRRAGGGGVHDEGDIVSARRARKLPDGLRIPAPALPADFCLSLHGRRFFAKPSGNGGTGAGRGDSMEGGDDAGAACGGKRFRSTPSSAQPRRSPPPAHRFRTGSALKRPRGPPPSPSGATSKKCWNERAGKAAPFSFIPPASNDTKSQHLTNRRSGVSERVLA